MKRKPLRIIGLIAAGLVIAAAAIYQIPSVKDRVNWKWELANAYVDGVLNPAGDLPTPLPLPHVSHQPMPSATTLQDNPGTAASTTEVAQSSPAAATDTPAPTPTNIPLPASANLNPPKYEKQDQNNCGPATLAMYLRFFGWSGDQYAISNVVKPDITDRNVNVDELIYFVRTHVGWLNADYRVGGNADLLKAFIANGMPIMIEEASLLDTKSWPDDDLWAGHYLLLTGYDDANQTFTVQDTWKGANMQVTYKTLDSHWQAFNRVYIPIYQPDQAERVKAIIGADWDEATDRKDALATAQAEAEANPTNGFAWFNVGTNLLYFSRYADAAQAYDTARKAGLPQRMLRYQFGPFIAYFRMNRADDLMSIAEYALKITPNSEENLLWHGWAYYLKNDKQKAIDEFKKALKANPTYSDAEYALSFLGAN
jgi:hypothetical protein